MEGSSPQNHHLIYANGCLFLRAWTYYPSSDLTQRKAEKEEKEEETVKKTQSNGERREENLQE